MVGLVIKPNGIHVMKKVFRVNKFTGVITKRNTVEFGDGEFECDVTQLYENSHLDDEGYLVLENGERIDLTDVDVTVEVGLKDIEIIDTDSKTGKVSFESTSPSSDSCLAYTTTTLIDKITLIV